MLRLHLMVKTTPLVDVREGGATNAAPISGVTALDVAPDATSQGVALLRQYRDGSRNPFGNWLARCRGKSCGVRDCALPCPGYSPSTTQRGQRVTTSGMTSC